MHIAVTGGRGQIGSVVVALAAAQGHTVVNIDSRSAAAETTPPGVTAVQAELTDYDAFVRAIADCDALIHLAAIPSPVYHLDHIVHNNNVVSSYNGLMAAAALGIRRVCLASSINATGAFFSRCPRFDYFPLDEQHPTYNEDGYSLSKWIGEQQADSVARRYGQMSIASLRFHGTRHAPPPPLEPESALARLAAKQLWGWTRLQAAAAACLLSLSATFTGHEIFYIVAPETTMNVPSLDLRASFYPDVPVRGDLSGRRSFFNCAKAETLLGWRHEE